MFNTVLDPSWPGRIAIGVIVLLVAIGLLAFICYRKSNNKVKYWFTPVGLHGPLYLNRHKLIKSDYIIWASISGVYLVYWFFGYLVVNIIQMAEFSSAVQLASQHQGIVFVWDPTKVTANNTLGAFNAIFYDLSPLPNDAPTLMPFVMSQTNVNYYLFDLINSVANGTNIENGSKELLSLPTGSNFLLPSQNLDPYNISAPNYINNFYSIASNGQSNYDYLNKISFTWLHSFIYSNIFLTPLCQFLSVAFPVSIICSRKKDVASFFAPWAFLGGAITLYGGVLGDDNIHVSAQFIFYDQQMFFLYHFFIFTTGISWFAYSNRYSLSRFLYTFLMIISYVIWVLIFSNIFDIQYFTTGLTAYDISVSGSYEVVPEILYNTNIVFPGNSALMISVFVGIVVVFISIKNTVHYFYWKKRSEQLKESFWFDFYSVYKKLEIKIRKFVINTKKHY